jgi:predicted dehydrogenase
MRNWWPLLRAAWIAPRLRAAVRRRACHGSYQALADDPEVDVIYIATPHPMHHENACCA